MLSVFLMLIGAFGCAGSEYDFNPDEPPSPDENEDGDSGTAYRLVIDFQDGFDSDTVQIEVDGDLVHEENDVSTSLLTGIASSYEVAVEEGEVSLTVQVPTQDTRSSIDLEISADTFVGVSLVDGMIEFFVSDTPFGYG